MIKTAHNTVYDENPHAEFVVAVDFDGTLVKFEYPDIGEEVPHAFEYLDRFAAVGIKIILWTCRGSQSKLQEAVQYLFENDVPLHGINDNNAQKLWSDSAKAHAHIYIDDAALGCPLIHGCHSRPYVDWNRAGQYVLEMHKQFVQSGGWGGQALIR